MVEKGKAKLINLVGGIKVADLAIFDIGNQAMQKAKHISSIKAKARKWSTLMAKAQCDKKTTKQK